MEKIIYELRPFFFMLIGIAAAMANPDRLTVISSLLLIVASAYIVRNRMKHRAWLATP
jgi:uncharacterized membrane protein YecN with MAPEG domain